MIRLKSVTYAEFEGKPEEWKLDTVKTPKDWTQKRRGLRSVWALLRTPLLLKLKGREIAQ